MLGLSNARKLYNEKVFPLLESEAPEILNSLAIGLVGEGSECFGFDDIISQDHDYGVSLCFWLQEEKIEMHYANLEAQLVKIPTEFENFPVRISQQSSQGRCGIQSIEGFYGRYIGFKNPPSNWQEWRRIPESFLAVVTNGEVFYDECGEFSDFRKALLAFYPEDIRLKKMAARCAIMAQAGQYNLLRSVKRNDYTTSMLCVARFAEAALSLTYLLNKRYMPFYKWANKNVSSLPILGKESYNCLEKISAYSPKESQELIDIIEEYCMLVAKNLNTLNLSQIDNSWLLAHATEIQSQISIPQLRALPEMAE